MSLTVASKGPRDVPFEVVAMIAEREGVDPLDLDPPLSEAIDTDALNVLLSGPENGKRSPSIEITFSYNGYAVTVTNDGEVTLADSIERFKY